MAKKDEDKVVEPKPIRNAQPTIQQIIDEFWNRINSHPDVKLLTCSLGGRPEKGTEFPLTPSSQQHKMEIRFVYRESIPKEVAVKSSVPGPYEPGGKFYHLIPKKEEPSQEPENGPKKSWEHLLPPSRKAEEPAAV